jgi:tRNA-specific 2-thiouridylase
MKKTGAVAKKVLVGVSGGPSSAVTAALLKSQGYQVQCVFLQLVDPKTGENGEFGARCCLESSEAQAREICRKLDVPLHVVPVSSRFDAFVVDGFVHDVLQARQPNPCLPCNVEIRFKRLLDEADRLGCEKVATGHHAQIFRDAATPGGEGRARLLRAANARQDQSYFLFGLTQEQLARLLFPLGGFQEAMIGKLAREFELPDQSKGDPQAICLSSAQACAGFFEKRTPPSLRPGGVIRTVDGTVLGDHKGLYQYRIGSRVKLAPHVKEQDKYQVIGFDVVGHALIIGQAFERVHQDALASRAVWVRKLDGLHGLTTTARLSPGQGEALPCRVTHFENAVIRVEFEKPTPELVVGQAIVFYDGEEVLGGAYVDKVGSFGKV